MKRFAAITVMVMMVLCLLCGCSQGTESEGTTTTTQATKTLTVDDVVSSISTTMAALLDQPTVTKNKTTTEDGRTLHSYLYHDGNAMAIIVMKDGEVVEIRGLAIFSTYSGLSEESAFTMAELMATVPAGVLCDDVAVRFGNLRKESPNQNEYTFTYNGWKYTEMYSYESDYFLVFAEKQ